MTLKHFLNQESGFICRQEVPDKGCDFDVELILQNENASSWKFPIQLKSVQTITLVNKDEFISYSFETSRLGYLMRRIPSMGIVVLYSIEQNECFYEYADKVYSRLMEERDSDEWKKNDKVSIHIPYTNVLSKKTAIDIHETMTKRFEQALTMQNSYGPKYGLPAINLKEVFEYDFNNLDHIIKFLESNGQSLITNYDIDMIFKMVTRVPHLRIYGNKDLLLIAAVAYSEAGLNSESQIFCDRSKKVPLTPEEQLMVDFITLKNQLALGYISNNDFLAKLKELNRIDLDKRNKLTVEINIIRYELLDQKAFKEIPETLLLSIEKIFDDIRNSDWNDRTKGSFMLWNCENLSQLAFSMMNSSLGDFQIREVLRENIPIEERRHAVINCFKIENKIHAIITEIAKIAGNNNDDLVSTNAYALDVRHFLMLQINLISFDSPKRHGDAQRVRERISNASLAYNNFINLNLYTEAYDTLCNLVDLVELAEGFYFIEQPHKSELYQAKQQFEHDFEVIRRDIAILNLINSKAKTNEKGKGMAFCKNLDDDQINFLAQKVLKSLKLPAERLMNITQELIAYRMFYQRCTDESIEVIQVKTFQDYSLPIHFCLRSRLTGLQTLAGKDMDSLLKGWGF